MCDLLSCFCRSSSLFSMWLRCWRLMLCRGVLGCGGGEDRLQRGSSWYCLPRLSPQKLKILDTPENAPDTQTSSRIKIGVLKQIKNVCLYRCRRVSPDRAVHVFPVLGSASPSFTSLKFIEVLCTWDGSMSVVGGVGLVCTGSSSSALEWEEIEFRLSFHPGFSSFLLMAACFRFLRMGFWFFLISPASASSEDTNTPSENRNKV